MGISRARLQELQKEHLLILAKHGEPKFTESWFPYTSGKVGPYYIESTVVEDNGHDYHKAIDAICEIIKGTVGLDDFEAISGGDSRDWDFSNPVAYVLEKPHAKLYKNKSPKGAQIARRRFIHVADLNNEGSSMRDLWYPAIAENDGTMSHVYFYVDRNESGVQVTKDLGLNSYAVVTLDSNAWQVLKDNSIVSEKVYRSLNERMEDKLSWAHNALRAYPDKLGRLLMDETTRDRGIKILNVGYPEMKDEMLDILQSKNYDIRGI